MSKRGLGKGLDALIPQLNVNDGDVVVSVNILELRPNPYQPRQEFDVEKLNELAESVRQHGIIQPIVVRKSAIRGFEIVAGERRFRAAQKLKFETVPAVVRDFSDEQLMEIALIENLQRENLNAIEIAEAYANLMDKCRYTQDELAKRVGQSRSHVANVLRLLQLPPAIRTDVSRGTLSMGHARALLALESTQEQLELAKKAKSEDWSVRKLEALVYDAKPKNVSRETKDIAKERVYRQYEDQFRSFFGTSVKIQRGKKRGKIEIEYFSDDDLERILDLLVSTSE